MRLCRLLLLAGALHAAVVRGTVVENLSGHAISRASVILEPVPGSAGKRMVARTDRFGFFEFAGADAGVYLLQATRVPFLPVQYGQKRWNSAGMPLAVTESDSAFLTLRMVRYGSISGQVVDENDVGQPEFEVAAYRNTTPPQLIAHSTADERGNYRIAGLLPGYYLIRTAAKQLEEIGYKPTFSKETETPEQAHVVSVEIEQDSSGVTLRPLPGKLFSLAVEATTLDPWGMPITLTFVSDMTRQVVHSDAHTFTGLPAGDYEVFAEAPTETPGLKQSAYQRVTIGRDSGLALQLRKHRDVTFQFDGLPLDMPNRGDLRVLARRKDLAGFHDEQVLKLGRSANLTVGPWELLMVAPETYYVSGFSGPGLYNYRRDYRAEGWNAMIVNDGGMVRFTLSSNPSGLHGLVMDSGNPVVGAPVYLEPLDLDAPHRLSQTYVAITGTRGDYRFLNLAPGRYRVLSTYEYQAPDSEIMVNAGARELAIDPRADVALDLDLYVIR